MKPKKLLSFLLATAMTISLLPTFTITVSAEEYMGNQYETTGLYYTKYDTYCEITDCDTSVASVTIPKTIENLPVTSIGDAVFTGCHNLESITIPESITTMGTDIFYYCKGLKSVTVNSAIVGDRMFYGCSNLTSVNFGANVKKIGAMAFLYCSMESIEIPVTVEKIDSKAFYDCSKLKNILILNDNIDICDGAFSGCSSLENIDFLPQTITSIGVDWFSGCKGLTNLTIPERITSIGADAFYGCSNLTNLTLHDGITNIGTDAFYGCGFSSITLPKGIKSISDRMFMDCKNLTSLDIPNGVTSIGSGAFSGCNNLKSINIPKSVTSIGWRAFLNCENLNNVNYDGTKEEWKKIAIDNKYNGNKNLNNATINYLRETKTTTTVSENIFTVTGKNIDGYTVILALYKDDGQGGSQLVDCKTAVYSGNSIPLTTTATDYTSAKVMVWKDLETLEPVTEVENVNLGQSN